MVVASSKAPPVNEFPEFLPGNGEEAFSEDKRRSEEEFERLENAGNTSL